MELPILMPSSAPAAQRQFVINAVPILRSDPRIVGVTAAGSWADDSMDEHSDVDLVIAVRSCSFDEVMVERELIASAMGNLVACFTGEHVGEPRC